MAGISAVVIKYKEKLNTLRTFRLTQRRFSLDDKVTRLFVLTLVEEQDLFFDFLRECKLIKSAQTCEACGKAMILAKIPRRDGYRWYCGKKQNGKICRSQKSIRHGSWFSRSRLSMETIFVLTYEILVLTSASDLTREYSFSHSTVAEWRSCVKETLVEYLETNSEMIGGEGVVVEIDERKFGKKKMSGGNWIEGQWVLGGVDRQSGMVFLVAIHDRSADTLTRVIKEWVKPGSIICTDSWKAYDRLEAHGFTHLTADHNLRFMDPETSIHTNTIRSTWRHVKRFVPGNSHIRDFHQFLADYLFDKLMKNIKEDKFSKFLEIVSCIDWESRRIASTKLV